MKDPYCREYESRSESREDVDIECALSGNEEGGARVRRDFAGERSEVRREPGCWELVCCGELDMTASEWERYLELGYVAENRYDLVDVVLVSRPSMREDGEFTEVIGGLCSLIRRLGTDVQRAKCLRTEREGAVEKCGGASRKKH